MKKLQFKYDGSEDAKKCIEWVNEGRKSQAFLKWNGEEGTYYNSDLSWDSRRFPDYTLLTPTEFLREVTGEWQPKYGEIVNGEWNGQQKKGHYITTVTLMNGETRHLIQPPCSELLDVCTSIRQYLPMQLQSYIQDAYNCYIPSDGIQRIIEMVKGGEKA